MTICGRIPDESEKIRFISILLSKTTEEKRCPQCGRLVPEGSCCVCGWCPDV